ncbi:MAG: cysteine synthase A [Nitrospinota bacterium]
MRADSIIDLIGSTPIIRLNKIAKRNSATIYAKVEAFNPGGSVKDRIALSMVEDAERSGLIEKGGTIIEPTRGNTGIALAIVGAVKGYKVILVVSEDISSKKRLFLNYIGAEVELSDAKKGMRGAMDRAEEMVAKNPNYFMPRQFSNLANPEIHRRTTAKEILKAMSVEHIDAFVAGVGTGGTITGIGEVLKGKNSTVKVVAVEPAASPVISGGKVGSHRIPGIGAGFIPEILNTNILDEVIAVNDDDAYITQKDLLIKEGLMVGPSSGAACFAAIKIAQRIGRKKNVVVIFPDRGNRV